MSTIPCTCTHTCSGASGWLHGGGIASLASPTISACTVFPLIILRTSSIYPTRPHYSVYIEHILWQTAGYFTCAVVRVHASVAFARPSPIGDIWDRFPLYPPLWRPLPSAWHIHEFHSRCIPYMHVMLLHFLPCTSIHFLSVRQLTTMYPTTFQLKGTISTVQL